MSQFNLSALAVRERSITLFLIVAIILSGTYAFVHLGRAEDPSFTIKTLTVTSVWPGATAQEMQDLVAERVLSGGMRDHGGSTLIGSCPRPVWAGGAIHGQNSR
jgi:hypothetical protein